jgi:hypothetical protein
MWLGGLAIDRPLRRGADLQLVGRSASLRFLSPESNPDHGEKNFLPIFAYRVRRRHL